MLEGFDLGGEVEQDLNRELLLGRRPVRINGHVVAEFGEITEGGVEIWMVHCSDTLEGRQREKGDG